jgi:hypothetical protein
MKILVRLIPFLRPYWRQVAAALAERAAWDYVAGTPGAPELSVVNPAFVLGPAPDADLSTSVEVIRVMGSGAYPMAPKIAFPVSDVRDVAVTHVLAMTHPEAAGQRFITANGFLRLVEVGRLVERADVVQHNMRYEAAIRLGVDDESLRKINPQLIYCHTAGFDPRRAHLPGNDQTGACLAGIEFEDGGVGVGGKGNRRIAALVAPGGLCQPRMPASGDLVGRKTLVHRLVDHAFVRIKGQAGRCVAV